jgi:hypothetical protein
MSTNTDVRVRRLGHHRCMTLSRTTVAVCLLTGLMALPTLGYAAFVAVETASYIPFPGEDVSRHRAAYLFSALLGGTAVGTIALAAIGVRVARRSRSRQTSTSTAITTTGLAAAALALGVVGATVLL